MLVKVPIFIRKYELKIGNEMGSFYDFNMPYWVFKYRLYIGPVKSNKKYIKLHIYNEHNTS